MKRINRFKKPHAKFDSEEKAVGADYDLEYPSG